MNKKRVLVVGDKSVANTGFATYKKELLQRLHSCGKYKVGEYAFCGALNERNKVAWDYIPCVAMEGEDDREAFAKNAEVNKNGRWRWEGAVLHWKPDVVISVQDPWQVDYISFSPLRDFYNLYLAAPVDSHPQRDRYLQIYHSADFVVPYTQYAKDVLTNAGLSNLTDPVPMGVDLGIFRPLDKKKVREDLYMDIPEGAVVLGKVARNQPRKRLPELMRAFKKFLRETGKDAYLYLHTTYQEQMPWDLVRNLMDNQIVNRVLFSYVCEKSRKLFVAPFRDEVSWSPHTGEMTGRFLNPSNAPSFDELNKVYNSFDMYLQMANAEGFCVPIIEAASTNIPIWGVNYSAYAEVIKEVGGNLLDPLSLEEDIGVGSRRAVMPIDDIATMLSDENSWKGGENGRQMVKDKYTWDICFEGWQKIIDESGPHKDISEYPPQIVQSFSVGEEGTATGLIDTLASKLPNKWGPMHMQNLVNLAQGRTHINQLVEFYKQQINQLNQLETLRVSSPAKPYWVP